MKTKTKTAIAATLAIVGLTLAGSPAVARQGNQNGLVQVGQADKVYGNEVISSDNQKLGKLNNLMVDIESGRILYGVIGASKGRIAVPPGIFTSTLPGSDKNLHVNVTKAKLEAAPQFSSGEDKAENWGQASFASQVYSYFGQSPWWQGSTPANQGSFHNVHKASQVISMKVENASNQPLGKIYNVMVDLPPGRLVYLLLEPDSTLNLGNNIYVLPPQTFTLSQDHKYLVSGIDKDKLAGAPHFASGQMPNFSDMTFASQVYNYFGKQPYFQGGGVQPTGR